MMWGNGFGMGGGWLLGGLMMLLFWAAVIGLIVWAIWAFSRRQPGRVDYSNAPQAPQSDRALQIAKERYARGEISREQYDEIRQTLGA
jgi:putative membrane protein